MTDGRNVQIEGNAQGCLIATGDQNVLQYFQFFGEPSPDLLENLRTGKQKASELREAVPLPTLTLAIAFEDERTRWHSPRSGRVRRNRRSAPRTCPGSTSRGSGARLMRSGS